MFRAELHTGVKLLTAYLCFNGSFGGHKCVPSKKGLLLLESAAAGFPHVVSPRAMRSFSDFKYFNYVHTAKQEQIITQRVENRPHSTSSPRAQLSHSSRPIRMLQLPVSVLESCWCAQLEATVPFTVLWKSQQSQSGLKEKKTTNKHIYHWEKALSGIVCSLNVSLTWKALLHYIMFSVKRRISPYKVSVVWKHKEITLENKPFWLAFRRTITRSLIDKYLSIAISNGGYYTSIHAAASRLVSSAAGGCWR